MMSVGVNLLDIIYSRVLLEKKLRKAETEEDMSSEES